MTAAGWVRGFVRATVLVAVVLVVPVAAGAVVGGTGGVGVSVCAALYVVLVAVRAGWGRALAALPVIAAAVLAGGVLAYSGAWVALLAALAAAAGAATVRGLGVPALLVGAAAASAPPLPADADALARVAWVLAVGAYVVLAARALRLPRVVPVPLLPRRVAAVVAVVLAAVVGACALLAQASGNRYGYWAPAAAFLMALPVPGLRVSRAALQRVLGTAAGVAAGVGVATLGVPLGVRLALAAVGIVVTVAVPRPLWLSVGTTSLALVLLLDPGGSGLVVGELRLLATAVAAVLVLAGVAVLVWLVPRLAPARGTPAT
ncbi:FUSC family protein [Xylanimonas protaetiae]|uniref:Integral membrane bound transporter domain-containing protein n=1 Tax=Xylanimonas protaetiae TaxID=2509457 RepID=A0A4P6F9S2_9MICO|nr:FUSC family protein [Xylanimonas protaetiae]QAY71029.1 hypothetical protein ET471_14135 [Xylanimonas protaetiae]